MMTNANKAVTAVERLLTGHITVVFAATLVSVDGFGIAVSRRVAGIVELLALCVLDVLLDMLGSVVCRGRTIKSTAGCVWKER